MCLLTVGAAIAEEPLSSGLAEQARGQREARAVHPHDDRDLPRLETRQLTAEARRGFPTFPAALLKRYHGQPLDDVPDVPRLAEGEGLGHRPHDPHESREGVLPYGQPGRAGHTLDVRGLATGEHPAERADCLDLGAYNIFSFHDSIST